MGPNHQAGNASPNSSTRGVPLPAVLLVLGSCTSLQFGAALAAHLFPRLGAAGVTTLRLSLAALILLAISRPRIEQYSRQQWLAIVAFGATLGGMNGLFYEAIARIPLGPAVALEFLGPLGLAAVLSRKLRDFAWIALALVGVAFLGFDGNSDPLDTAGVIFVLGAGFFWALYILASERVGGLVDGVGGLACALVVGAVIVLPFGAPGALKGVTHLHYLGFAIGTALLASVLPYAFELSALRQLPKAVFGVLLAFEPVIAALAGWVLLGQDFGLLRAVAVLLVVTAGVGSALTSSRKSELTGVVPDDAPDEVISSAHP